MAERINHYTLDLPKRHGEKPLREEILHFAAVSVKGSLGYDCLISVKASSDLLKEDIVYLLENLIQAINGSELVNAEDVR